MITYGKIKKYHNGYTQEYSKNGNSIGLNWGLTTRELSQKKKEQEEYRVK